MDDVATVLVVDRERSARATLVRRIERSRTGLRVVEGDSIEALRVELHDRGIDCVVTEHDLPDGDALDCVATVRDADPSIPVVVYTDAGSERLASDALAAGAAAYVPRSAGAELLCERLETALSLGDVEVTPGETGGSPRETILEQAPVAIIEWNLDLTVARWNPKAEAIFGYSCGEAVGEHALELLVPDDLEWSIERGWERLCADGEPSRRVNRNVRADGTTITCEWNNTPLTTDGEVVSVLSFVQDVTDRERRRDHVEVVNRVLRHDLRNGLNVVSGAVESLASLCDDPAAERYASIANREVESLVDLADRTRTIETVLERGQTTESADIIALVESVVATLGERYPNATIETTLPDAAPATVSVAFERAIDQLLDNAIVHNDDDPRVWVRVETAPDAVVITIEDDGPGIPEEERAPINATVERTQLHHASGIGLWLANRIVALSGGELSVERTDGRTRVRVDVPAATPETRV